MIYVKSIVSGIAASAVAVCVLYVAALLMVYTLTHKYTASEPDSYFVRWHLHFWPVLCIALSVFALGFYWELRRASR
jgi:hypothetical protein